MISDPEPAATRIETEATMLTRLTLYFGVAALTQIAVIDRAGAQVQPPPLPTPSFIPALTPFQLPSVSPTLPTLPSAPSPPPSTQPPAAPTTPFVTSRSLTSTGVPANPPTARTQGPSLPPAVRDFIATFDPGPASGATKSLSAAKTESSLWWE